MAIEGRLNFGDVKDQLFDELGNRKRGCQIVVFDKGTDGLWHRNEYERLDTLSGYYHILDVDGQKKIYYQINDSLLPINMDFNSPDCHRCYKIGDEIPIEHKIIGNEVLAVVSNHLGDSYKLLRQDYSDIPSFYTFQDARGNSCVQHGEHNLFVLLKTLENFYAFNKPLSEEIKKIIPEMLEKELTPSDIKILSVEEPYDTDFGASVIQYQLGDVISFAFSDMEPEDVLAYPGWAAKDVELTTGLDTDLVKWSDISNIYLDVITCNPFEMYFIEEDDCDWTEEMVENLESELARLWGRSNTVTCGEDGALVTIYAGAMGEINWSGHEYYGKPCFEHVLEMPSLDEKIQSASSRAVLLGHKNNLSHKLDSGSAHDSDTALAIEEAFDETFRDFSK